MPNVYKNMLALPTAALIPQVRLTVAPQRKVAWSLVMPGVFRTVRTDAAGTPIWRSHPVSVSSRGTTKYREQQMTRQVGP